MLALNLAWLVNSAIVIMAAGGVLHARPGDRLDRGARTRRWRRCWAALRGAAFAVALLAAGPVLVDDRHAGRPDHHRGLSNVRFGLFLRRLITVVPALLVIALGLDAYWILILSQVSLSIQLPFAIVPLVWLTARRPIMGRYVNARATTVVAAAVAGVIIALNVALLAQFAGIG